MKYFLVLMLLFVLGCSNDNNNDGNTHPERPLTLEEAHFAGKNWCDVTEVSTGQFGNEKCDVNVMHSFSEQPDGTYVVTVESIDHCLQNIWDSHDQQYYISQWHSKDYINEELFDKADYTLDLKNEKSGSVTQKDSETPNTVNINYIENGFQYVSEDGEKVLSEFTSCDGKVNPLLEKLCNVEHFYKKGLKRHELRNDVKFCKGILEEVEMLDYYRKGIADSQ